MDNASVINAFKHMQVPLIIVDQVGAIVICNPAANRLFDYEDHYLEGHSLLDVLPIQSVAELDALIVPPAVDVIIKRIPGRNRSGNTVPLSIHITKWTDAEHGIQRALLLRDVTDEIDADVMANSELNLANNAINGAQIGVFDYNILAKTVIVSNIWRRLLGVENVDVPDIQLEWRSRVHPDDLDAALEPVRLCQNDLQNRAQCEYRIRSKDGQHWHWMQTDIAISQRDENGQVTHLIGSMTDITERKNIEEALRRSVQQFRLAFQSSPIGKAIVGLDGRWLSVNPALCKLFGYSEQDLLKMTFQELTHPDDLNEDLANLDLLRAGKISNYQIEKRYVRADKSVMWGLLSVGIVNDAKGLPEHCVSQIVDVTEQRRLSELKSEFVATVSHELRTPLTSVLGSLSLLSMMNKQPISQESQRLLHIAQENGKRLQALINDILDFEKFSMRQMRLSLTRNRIADLVDEAVTANSVVCGKYNVTFKVHCPDRTIDGFVDPKRFQQVMTNLLTNAAKFARTGSVVDISIVLDEDMARVAISNSGEGIPNAFRERIFTPFSQADSSATRARGGTGLGLNITKQIVEQSGGAIGFDSTLHDRTTFWFTVPLAEPERQVRIG